METPEPDPDEVKKLLDIGHRMQQGEKVSFQDQLRFLRYREKALSSQLTAGDADAYHPLENIRTQIEAINKQITDSGRSGGGMTGEASKRDAHKPEH